MMAVEEKESQAKSQITEEVSHELHEHSWSVVSFDKSEANGLTYPEAEQKLAELAAEKVTGLCIITDEAAARIVNKN